MPSIFKWAEPSYQSIWKFYDLHVAEMKHRHKTFLAFGELFRIEVTLNLIFACRKMISKFFVGANCFYSDKERVEADFLFIF